MVASNANLIPMKARAKTVKKVCRAKAKITQKENGVLRRYMRIPVLNELFIHFVNRLEGASSVTNNVGMRKVGIGYKPFIHCLPQSLPTYSAAFLHLPKEDDYP